MRQKGEGQKSVALIGFMGAGKSTVGRLLGQRLALPFIDLDEVIAEKAQKSVTQIFRDHGEVGFRAHERAALRELLEEGRAMVLALGGGTFADSAMRGWVQRAARTVYLKVSVDVLMARLAKNEQRARRPLLSGPDPAATVKRLLAERTPAYEECEVVVDADSTSPEDLVETLVHALRDKPRPVKKRVEAPAVAQPLGDDDETLAMRTQADGSSLLRVHASTGSYPVELRPDAGPWIADAVAQVCPGNKLALFSDSTVAALHAGRLLEGLKARGKTVSLHTFAPGEGSKSLATAGRLYDELLDSGISRQDAVVALGGGVVGDVAGFVAATFMRGIAFVQVPTTTLAAVDASVGGKTAVNTPRGKNLVGAFHAPRAVLIAAEHLKSQPRREHAAGLVEALKMAATFDESFFQRLERDASRLLDLEPALLLGALAHAVGLKAQVVARDEREQGERAILNYGHTIGHAIETGEQYRLLHGEAVALGMVAEAQLAERHGWSSGVSTRLEAALKKLDAPVAWRLLKVDRAALGLDKKRAGGAVKLPVVPRLGRSEVREVPFEVIEEFLRMEVSR